MNDHVGDVHCLVLHVGGYVNVVELEKLFDGGKDSCGRVSRMLR